MERSNLLENESFAPKPRAWVQKLSYGLGHVHNDLCAAVWFSYTLFYLQIVLQLDSTTAGTLIMLGQVVDAVATPGAGWAVDRIGTRQAWHLAGTLAVGVGFSLMFSVSPGATYWWSLLWYGGLITLFQVGWATVQISHLSIIPSIARDHTHSADLTTIRYTASVCCGIAVYLITWVVLKNGRDLDAIGPADFYKFREIALIITFIGLSSSALFYYGTQWTENRYHQATENGTLNSSIKSDEHPSLLKTAVIYQVSLLYMASRLLTTLSLIYIPLYLEERQTMVRPDNDGIREAVATVPLVCFLASFTMSLVLKWRPKHCTHKVTYLMGSIFSLTGFLWIALGAASDSRFQIYGIAALIGLGSSSTMISSLCLTANFAKTNGFRGGSVYGTVTFADKLVSGAIVLITQHLNCESVELCPNFYRLVLAYVCGGAAIAGVITLGFLHYTN